MSEQLKAPTPERLAPSPELSSSERTKSPEAGAKHETEKFDLDKLQRSIEQHAASRHEVAVEASSPSDASDHSFATHKQIRREAYSQTMQRVQAKLAAPERVFSRFAHQPAVEAVSNAAATTIARPSGILGGATLALLGSSTLLYLSRTYGFAYNNSAFFLLAVGGFGIGLLIELAVRRLRR